MLNPTAWRLNPLNLDGEIFVFDCWNPHAFMATNPKPLVLPCFSRQTSAQQGTQQCSQQDRGGEKPWKRHAESWPKGRRRLLSVFVYLLQ